MFLKNVPPVVALHTEWRSYGSSRAYSLPLCFNDSDSDIPTTGTPIPEKVQMIIESLRSSQSSLDMNDEHEGATQPGRSTYTNQFGDSAGVQNSAEDQITDAKGVESQDSDSDDSVDRGIEEAIQEYLKEKGDQKLKAEPAPNAVTLPKPLSREHPGSDLPKHADGNKMLTASSNRATKGAKAAQSSAVEKKRIKTEGTSAGNHLSFKKEAVGKVLAVKNQPSFEMKKVPIALAPFPNGAEDSSDSSSDDGIEEAIRRYQLEKQKEKTVDGRKTFKPLQPKEEFDSSSDDGIEEAIRHYQLEKQKENRGQATKISKPSGPKHTQGGKDATQSTAFDTQMVKKTITSTKRKAQGPDRPATVVSCHSISKPLSSFNVDGSSTSPTSNVTPAHLRLSAPLKVNTTDAELMCAEAILDISKAVMPAVLDHTGTFSDSCDPPAPIACVDPAAGSGNGSDESSVDSDEGIEQEIREFLELKAQMRKQPPEGVDLASTKSNPVEPQQKKKVDTAQDKKVKLSLSRKRKLSNDNKVQEGSQPFKSLTMCDRSKSPWHSQSGGPAATCSSFNLALTAGQEGSLKNGEKKNTQGPGALEQEPTNLQPTSLKREESKLKVCVGRAQSGDKSSSLDSDEDLDSAIKDLLKTKKKIKRKTRDVKVKTRKSVSFGSVELCLLDAPDSEKKALTEQKTGTNLKTPKSCLLKSSKTTTKQSLSDKHSKRTLNKNTSELLRTVKRVKPSGQVPLTGGTKGQVSVAIPSAGDKRATTMEEDSSSVDSDDSIEQEIRRFLAEKAKVSTVGAVAGEENRCADSKAGREMKMEAQQVEVTPTMEAPCSGFSLSGGSGHQASWGREDLQSMPADRQGSHSLLTDKSPPLATTTHNLFLPSNKLNRAGEGQKSALGLEKYPLATSEVIESSKSIHKIGPCVPSTNTVPVTESVFTQSQSQNPFHTSSARSARATEVRGTNASDLPEMLCSHPLSSYVPADQACHIVCPVVGDGDVSIDRSTNAYSLTSILTSDRHLGKCYMQRPAKESSKGQSSNIFLSENPVHRAKDPAFHSSNCGQVRSRDLGLWADRGELTGKREDVKIEAVEQVDEEYVDETDSEAGERGQRSEREHQRRVSLSTTIDPGMNIRPYIALDTPQRMRKYTISRKLAFTEHQQTTKRKLPATSLNPNTPNFSVAVKMFYAKKSPSCVKVFDLRFSNTQHQA